MRSLDEIIGRLRNYESNLDRVRDIQRKLVIKQAIIELSWVLGESSNLKYGEKRI